MSNLRNYQRIRFQTTATILVEQQHIVCEVMDLALRGALLQTEDPLPIKIGACIQIKIELPDSDLKLTFGAELIHHEQHQYGFLFIDADVESLAHLRRLLELNLGDGEQIDREFIHWLGVGR